MTQGLSTGWLRRVLGSCLITGMLMLSFPVAWANTPVPVIIETKLPTGQTLYIKEDHSQPIVTIDTWVKTGSVNETPEINGVSHFLEHLLFKGTATYKPGELDRILESRGAKFNAATSDDYTHYYITTATPYFEEALRLHADMLLNAAIPEEELPQERKVVQEEINRANDNPDRQLYMTLAKMLYGSHGYALDTL
ncbi:MAG TPA: pitrilysin family protein, partial [Oculatellaceae cyanobacterium]